MRTFLLVFAALSSTVLLQMALVASVHMERNNSEEPTELIFSHRYHVVEEEFECADCHYDVETSATGLDNLLPDMDVCSTCHDVEDDETCGTCHADPDYPRNVPRIDTYSEKFSHERHLAADFTCMDCHAEVAEQETVEPYVLPTMVACVDCHENQAAPNECMTCHLPGDRLKPVSHVATFLHTHSDMARNDAHPSDNGKTCQTCHDENFCQDCHQGDNVDRFTHPLNYGFTHALDAQANDQACVTCHTDRQFCNDCHRDNQVLPHTHTAGWALPGGTGGRHSLEALNDLESCISCHEQNADQVCQPCHQTGGGF